MIKNLEERKERYLRDALPIRMGGLAANLARVKSISQNPANEDVALSRFEESKFFIEWTAAEASPEIAERLIRLQLQIALWQRTWASFWQNDAERRVVATKASEWSQEILERSGLLTK